MARDPMIIRLEDGRREREREYPEAPQRNVPVLLYVIILVLLCGIATLVYFAYRASESTATPQQDIKELVGDVGLLMLLPSDEQPTIATVTDLAAVSDQPFFKNAKPGDVVLMYPKAGRAILYSPDDNIIVEVAPIVLDAQ